MTVLAYQLRNQKKSPSIMQINRTDLYKEVEKTKMGFEKWPEWIEKMVTRIILNDRYNKAKSMKKKKAYNPRKSTKIDMHGSIHMKDNYFN